MAQALPQASLKPRQVVYLAQHPQPKLPPRPPTFSAPTLPIPLNPLRHPSSAASQRSRHKRAEVGCLAATTTTWRPRNQAACSVPRRPRQAAQEVVYLAPPRPHPRSQPRPEAYSAATLHNNPRHRRLVGSSASHSRSPLTHCSVQVRRQTHRQPARRAVCLARSPLRHQQACLASLPRPLT